MKKYFEIVEYIQCFDDITLVQINQAMNKLEITLTSNLTNITDSIEVDLFDMPTAFDKIDNVINQLTGEYHVYYQSVVMN